MKLQAITVSVNYSDFLIHSLKENKQHFDKWIIVTDTKDLATKNLCDEHGVTCIQTDAFYEKGIFNKYAGINEGLKHVDKNEWILFLDSDIILHYETKRILRELDLNKTCLYGIDRLNCNGPKKWRDYCGKRNLVIENWLMTNAGFEFGPRLVHYYGMEGENGRFEGWRPLGFFQLAHGSQFDTYPEDTMGADHCDLIFARQWPRHKRVHIPEIMGIHLESEGAGKAVNWYGRKSKPFIINEEVDICTVETEVNIEIVEKENRRDSFKRFFELLLRYIRRYCCLKHHHHYYEDN